MMYWYDLILGLSALFLAYIFSREFKKSKSNFPPGPTSFPFQGYFQYFREDLHLNFIELGKIYGDVFSFRLGSEDIVVLNGADAISEAYNKTAFLGRPPNNGLEKAFPSTAFFGGNFHRWQEQRKFLVRFMKYHGHRERKFQKAVMDEINVFMEVLRNYQGEPVDVEKPLGSSVANNVYTLVLGNLLANDDPERQLLDQISEEVFENISQNSLDSLFPFVQKIPFINRLVETSKLRDALEKFEVFLRAKINDYLTTIDPDQEKNFIDRYLEEINARKAENPDTSFNQNMLATIAIEIILAGTDTLRSSILWFLYVMAAFPDVQKKVQQEIMEVTGEKEAPEYQDMRNMPYTHAVLLEIMRWKSISPVNILHYTVADTTVGGYHVPEGTTVMANFWAVHHDPRHWKDPDKFNPENFLSKDGKSVLISRNFMSFSRGRRACPGESMAFMEMFLYFTSILREFDLAFPDGTTPTFPAKCAFLYKLEPYLLRFIRKTDK